MTLWDLLDFSSQRLAERAGHTLNALSGGDPDQKAPMPLLEFPYSEDFATFLGGPCYS